MKPGWRTSSYTGNGGGNCVEVGDVGRMILVRDTKDRTRPVLRFTPAAWRGFAERVKRSLVGCCFGAPVRDVEVEPAGREQFTELAVADAEGLAQGERLSGELVRVG